MSRFIQVFRSPNARTLAIALLSGVLFLIVPDVMLAQGNDMFGQATGFAQNVIKIIGWIMVIGGLILMVMGGFGVKEGRGGWSAMAVGVVLIFIGFKVTGGISSASAIFG